MAWHNAKFIMYKINICSVVPLYRLWAVLSGHSLYLYNRPDSPFARDCISLSEFRINPLTSFRAGNQRQNWVLEISHKVYLVFSLLCHTMDMFMFLSSTCMKVIWTGSSLYSLLISIDKRDDIRSTLQSSIWGTLMLTVIMYNKDAKHNVVEWKKLESWRQFFSRNISDFQGQMNGTFQALWVPNWLCDLWDSKDTILKYEMSLTREAILNTHNPCMI